MKNEILRHWQAKILEALEYNNYDQKNIAEIINHKDYNDLYMTLKRLTIRKYITSKMINRTRI